jgi:hypothetical protein
MASPIPSWKQFQVSPRLYFPSWKGNPLSQVVPPALQDGKDGYEYQYFQATQAQGSVCSCQAVQHRGVVQISIKTDYLKPFSSLIEHCTLHRPTVGCYFLDLLACTRHTWDNRTDLATFNPRKGDKDETCIARQAGQRILCAEWARKRWVIRLVRSLSCS